MLDEQSNTELNKTSVTLSSCYTSTDVTKVATNCCWLVPVVTKALVVVVAVVVVWGGGGRRRREHELHNTSPVHSSVSRSFTNSLKEPNLPSTAIHKIRSFLNSKGKRVTIRITNRCDFLYYVFISFFSSFPYMFRAFMGPSSGVFQAVVFMLPFGSCSALLIVFTSSTPKSPPQTSPLTHADDQQSTA